MNQVTLHVSGALQWFQAKHAHSAELNANNADGVGVRVSACRTAQPASVPGLRDWRCL
jgi:hypothetical protein